MSVDATRTVKNYIYVECFKTPVLTINQPVTACLHMHVSSMKNQYILSNINAGKSSTDTALGSYRMRMLPIFAVVVAWCAVAVHAVNATNLNFIID